MQREEMEIIRQMRSGKRLNVSRIARDLHLPISTVSDRIKRVEKKYVLKHSALLNNQSTGYFASAVLAIKASPEKKPEVLSFLAEQSCINSIYHTNSGYNFLVEAIFKDNLALLSWIEGIKFRFGLEVVHFPILKVEKKETFVPELLK